MRSDDDGAISAPLTGILLAAGRGRRFGSDKLLHLLDGDVPVALAAAKKLRNTCDRVLAVLRPEQKALGKMLVDAGCELVLCPQADGGMGVSLAAGVRAAPTASAWIVALADMPFISDESYRAVRRRLLAGASLVATQFDGKRGHPAGFSHEWFNDLIRLGGDQGARSIFERHPEKLSLCPVDDPGVRDDVDRPADLLRSR